MRPTSILSMDQVAAALGGFETKVRRTNDRWHCESVSVCALLPLTFQFVPQFHTNFHGPIVHLVFHLMQCQQDAVPMFLALRLAHAGLMIDLQQPEQASVFLVNELQVHSQ